MKKFVKVLFVIAISLTILACGNEKNSVAPSLEPLDIDPQNSSYFSAKLNGNAIDFSFPTATITESIAAGDLANSLAFGGTIHTNGTKGLTIGITMDQEITTGNYVEMFDILAGRAVIMGYTVIENGTIVNQYQTGINDNSELSINISEIDFRKGGSVSGTFSGKIFEINTNEMLTVTDGKFSMKISN